MTVVAVGVLMWLLGNVAFLVLRWRATADRRNTAPAVAGGSAALPVARPHPALADRMRSIEVTVPAQAARSAGVAAPASPAAQAVTAQSRRRTGSPTVRS